MTTASSRWPFPFRIYHLRYSLPLVALAFPACGDLHADNWQQVYSQNFDELPVGTQTASPNLPNWEGFSAAGVVFDGAAKGVGRFLVAASAWKSFNQGPIFNLDLAATPHDRVRVSFDLYTFGEW